MPDSPTRDLIREEAKHLEGARADATAGQTRAGSTVAGDHARKQVRRAITIQHYEQILDATLRNVDLDVLFPEILAQVRSLLEADEATVYLLDETSRDFYAAASLGMEQAVAAGLRIPVGKGIAGSVVVTGRSETLYDINVDTVANPLLVHLGIKSLVAAPIIIGDVPVGVLTVGCVSGRRYEQSEVRIMEVVAIRIGFAIERTRILHQVQVERARAERANRFKTTLMHMATHDIKTPLTTIKLQLAMLKGPTATPVAKDTAVAIITRSILRLEVILDDFLDLARIEGGRFTLAWSPIELHSVADEVVQMFAPHAEFKHLALTIDGGPAPLEADGRRITQVLVNLVSNAIRYTQHGSIVVHVGRTPASATSIEAAQILVTDTGNGMTPDQVGRLFQPFGQVHDGPQEGTGLGLHLSKVIVEAHGGRIWATSPGPDQGSTFHVELPLRRPPG